MGEMDTRARLSVAACSRREYAQVIADCRAIYCEQRLALILGFVQKRLMVSLLPHHLKSFVWKVLCMSYKSLHEFLSLSNVHAGVFEKAPTLRVYTRWMRLSTAGANTLLSSSSVQPSKSFFLYTDMPGRARAI